MTIDSARPATRIRFLIIATLGCLSAAASSASADDLLPPEHPGHEAVDHYIRLKWAAEQIEPAPQADDANLIRRVMLDLAGRIPTTAETKAFVAADDETRRVEWVDRLLAAPDFAFHHRNWLDEFLLPEKQNDRAWRDYLLTAARENRPWDAMFRELMLGRDGDPQHEAALTFLKERAGSVDDMTNDTSRMFFGVSINCAQCHDHPLVLDWEQRHYFGFASFFNRTYLTKKRTLAEKYSGTMKFKTTAGEEHEAEFLFLTNAVVKEPDIEKTAEQRKQEDEEVQRQMKDDKAPPPKPPEFSPRAALVELALQPEQRHFFAKSIVNRVWARFFGRGLIHPLDQMHSENPASHPELLEWLARDLVAHSYDLKRLTRHIVLSDAYGRSSVWTRSEDIPAPEWFAFAQPRVLTPRQYALSLLIATSNPASLPLDPPPDQWAQKREQLENAAGSFAGQLELPGEHFQVSVDEALLFSNNDRIERDFLRDSQDKLLHHLREIDDRPEMIESAYWAVLSRSPDAEETAWMDAYLTAREDRPEEAVRQVVWSLITSPELRFNY